MHESEPLVAFKTACALALALVAMTTMLAMSGFEGKLTIGGGAPSPLTALSLSLRLKRTSCLYGHGRAGRGMCE